MGLGVVLGLPRIAFRANVVDLGAAFFLGEADRQMELHGERHVPRSVLGEGEVSVEVSESLHLCSFLVV